jgi:hypothetical protein
LSPNVTPGDCLLIRFVVNPTQNPVEQGLKNGTKTGQTVSPEKSSFAQLVDYQWRSRRESNPKPSDP